MRRCTTSPCTQVVVIIDSCLVIVVGTLLHLLLLLLLDVVGVGVYPVGSVVGERVVHVDHLEVVVHGEHGWRDGLADREEPVLMDPLAVGHHLVSDSDDAPQDAASGARK